MNKPELLSPVGDFECLKAAVQNGADSIYLGASSFNARQRASNFDYNELEKAIKYAKLRNVKVHLTLNTLIKNNEFEDAVNLAITAYNLGVDAIIIQDLGLATYILKNYPEIPIHASTQMTVHNLEGVKQLENLGFSRIVLSRELSISEIENICKNTNVEIETFIHGALCISYSGQCLFSSIVGDRSGNRGLCAQPCRLPYELCDKNNNTINKGYLLSPRDVNGTLFLPDLIKAGVNCFKIEGRMKNPEYVAEVTRYYRKYIDLVCENINLPNTEIIKILKSKINEKNDSTNLTDKEELTQVFNRGNFSTGHLSPNENRKLIFKEKSNNMGVYIGKIQKINSNKGHLFVKISQPLFIGDRIITNNGTYTISELMIKGKNVKETKPGDLVEIGRMKGDIKTNEEIYKIEDAKLSKELNLTFNSDKEFKKIPLNANIIIKENQPISLEINGLPNTIYSENKVKIESNIFPEKAINSPISKERIINQISKTGNTQFVFNNINIELDENIFIPKISILNDLRRSALEKLQDMILEKSTHDLPKVNLEFSNIQNSNSNKEISLLLNQLDLNFNYTNLNSITNLYIPLRFFINKNYENLLKQLINTFSTYIYMPPIIRDTKNFNIENIIKKFNIKGGVISNIAQIKYFKNLEIIGNYNLNIYNNFSIEKLNEFKINKYTISPELSKDEINNLNSTQKSELIVYGKLPLMTNNYCYLGQSNKCYSDCKKYCTQNEIYYLKDRLGFKFRIHPDPTNNLTTIYNSKISSLKYDDLQIDNIRIDILDENPEEIQNIIDTFKRNERLEGKDYTNGKF